MSNIYATIEESIKSALAAGVPVPAYTINQKTNEFERIDRKMVKLSNELNLIAKMLTQDFKGIGADTRAGAVEAYVSNYRQGAVTRHGDLDVSPPSLTIEKPIEINLSAIKTVMTTIDNKRNSAIDRIVRMNAKHDAMIWQGDDASQTRVQWSLLTAGAHSGIQNAIDANAQYVEMLKKTTTYYTRAQETVGKAGGAINIRPQRLIDITAWLTRIIQDTQPHIDAAAKLTKAALEILRPEEQKRLYYVRRLDLEDLKETRRLLLETAEAFQDAERDVEHARQDFLQHCIDHPPALPLQTLQERTALLTEASISTMNQYPECTPIQIGKEGIVVYEDFNITPTGDIQHRWAIDLFDVPPETITPSEISELAYLYLKMPPQVQARFYSEGTTQYGQLKPTCDKVIQLALFHKLKAPITEIWNTYTNGETSLTNALNQTLTTGQTLIPQILRDPKNPSATPNPPGLLDIGHIFRHMAAITILPNPVNHMANGQQIAAKTVTTISNAKQDLAATKNRLTEIFLHNAPAFLKETSRLIDILVNEYLEPTKTMWTEYGSNEPSILGFFDTIGKTLHQGYATERHLLDDICDFAVPAFNNILDDTDLSPETKQTLGHHFASIVGTARRGFSYTLYTIEGIANGSVNLLSWAAGIVEYAAALGLTIVDLPTWGMDSLFGNPDAPQIIYRDWAHRRVHEGNVAIWEGIQGIIYLNNLTKDPEAMMYFLSGILEEICDQVDEKGIEGAYGYIVGNLLPDFLLCFVGVGELNMAAKASKATEAAEKTKATKWGRGAAAGAKTSGEAAKLRGVGRFGELIADWTEWNKLPVFVTPEGFTMKGDATGRFFADFKEFRQLKNVQRAMLEARDPATILRNGKTLDEMATAYAKNVHTNKRWTWADNMPEGKITDTEKIAVKDLAVKKGLIPDVQTIKKTHTNGKTYIYADFKSSGLVREEVQLPEYLWKASDAEQFKWLDAKIGGRPEGTTWHHCEKDGTMQLVDFGMHNITNHNGGRTLDHWAYRPEGR